MSDDTPTQKFDPVGVDAPTPVIGGPPTPPEGSAAAPVAGEGKSRRLVIILSTVGAALLIAVLILLILLLTRGTASPATTPSATPSTSPTPSQTPSASPTPSATPTPTPTQNTPPPQATGPRFSSFSAPSQESGCSMGTPDFTPPRPLVKVSWATKGADEAWFVMGNSDAADSGFMQIPLNGDQSSFQFPIEFPCSTDSTEFTITLVGPDGEHVHKRWTVQNTGDKF